MSILKDLRTQRNETQMKVAKALNITQQAYYYYESEQRQMPDDIKVKLADYFGVTVDYLLGRTDYPYNNAEPSPLKPNHITVTTGNGTKVDYDILGDDMDIVISLLDKFGKRT